MPKPAGGTGFGFILRALRYRNYRLFYGGQSISLIGTWMTRVATWWLVYRLTHSPWLLGLTGFAGQMPTFLLAPFAGVWVDRWDRHRVLVVTQTLAMAQSFALAALTLTGRITIIDVLLLCGFQGLINAFDMPGRQSFVVEMVENREDLGNAIALNSSMVNMARLLGPAIGGMVIAGWGEGYCFLADGVSYLAVIASLLAMRNLKPRARSMHTHLLPALREGWRYVSRFPPIRSILLLLALVSLAGMPFTVLMPIFAAQVLHGGPHTMGFLMGATGLGALIAAFRLAARRSVRGLTRVIPASSAIFGAGLVGFSFSRQLTLSLALMLVTGYGMMQQMAASNTVLQTLVEDDKRGRVMSYYTMAFTGMVPWGSLLAGALAQRLGAPHTLLLTGLCCVAGAALFTRHLPEVRRHMRPRYVELGIIAAAEPELDATAALLPHEEHST